MLWLDPKYEGREWYIEVLNMWGPPEQLITNLPRKIKIRLSSETTSLIGLILAYMLHSLMHEPNLDSKSGVCLHSPFQGVGRCGTSRLFMLRGKITTASEQHATLRS